MSKSLFNKVADLRHATSIQKGILTKVFSCELYKILKSSFFYRATRLETSVFLLKIKSLNDVASAIKTKSYWKKLPLREVYLEERKTTLTGRSCEHITGFKSRTIFRKRLHHRCLILL